MISKKKSFAASRILDSAYDFLSVPLKKIMPNRDKTAAFDHSATSPLGTASSQAKGPQERALL